MTIGRARVSQTPGRIGRCSLTFNSRGTRWAASGLGQCGMARYRTFPGFAYGWRGQRVYVEFRTGVGEKRFGWRTPGWSGAPLPAPSQLNNRH